MYGCRNSDGNVWNYLCRIWINEYMIYLFISLLFGLMCGIAGWYLGFLFGLESGRHEEDYE